MARSRHHSHEARPDEALLCGRDLWFARSGRTILEAVDIDIGPEQIVTLIGPNGAGKTTLVRLLLGLAQPDRGIVRRKSGLVIGYAPQRFDVDRAIPLTAARFLKLGGARDRSDIERVLQEVGAERVAEQQLSNLSGGELQRVILARALLRNSDLLVLDEPVRGVDYAGEAELYALIGRLRDTRGLSVLLVSHDLHVVMAKSDRVLCINRHVCCSGVPEAVARNPEYVRLFGPDAARAVAIYHHEHDHRHDLAGAPEPPPSRADGRRS
ncbi:MAG TPA: metal ABC transporter ATP-binding protein [Hyphomicrobiaceae bacterium]|nr:metal ABC transporter ATP-binding protein [Hyphomicrobiaceae bacterium]